MAAAAFRRRKLNFKVGRLVKATRAATAKALDRIANEMSAEISLKIDTQGPPRSAPNTPPHKEHGNLQRQTQVIRVGRRLVVNTTQVGIYLEGGTSNMKMRPFIRSTVHDQGQKWRRRINAEIRRNMKKTKRKG